MPSSPNPGAGRKALLNKRQLQQVIWGKECTQPPSYTGAHETILPFDLAPFDTECGAGYEYKCCIAYIPPPPAAAIAVECCLTASLCFVEVDVSGRLTSALKAFFATSPTATKPECLDTFLDRVSCLFVTVRACSFSPHAPCSHNVGGRCR